MANVSIVSVVEQYEQRLQKNEQVSTYGILKLLNDLMCIEDYRPNSDETIALRDRLYTIISQLNEKNQILGQHYFFAERQPRDDLYKLLSHESNLTAARVELMKCALQKLATSEKDGRAAKEKLFNFVEDLNRKIEQGQQR